MPELKDSATSATRILSYKQIFMKRLKEETVKDISEWVYAGGNLDSHLNWFLMNYSDDQKPEYEINCICSHYIKENCYIYNKTSGAFLVVGNCCINKVRKGEIGGDTNLSLNRQCKHCGDPTKNKKDPYCNECRGGIMKIGKYTGKSYRWIAENDIKYCKWYKNIKKGEYSDFVNFLKQEGYNLAHQYESTEPVVATLGNEVVSIGKYKGKTYTQLLAEDVNYCKWICSTSNFYDKKLQNWLNKQLC